MEGGKSIHTPNSAGEDSRGHQEAQDAGSVLPASLSFHSLLMLPLATPDHPVDEHEETRRDGGRCNAGAGNPGSHPAPAAPLLLVKGSRPEGRHWETLRPNAGKLFAGSESSPETPLAFGARSRPPAHPG